MLKKLLNTMGANEDARNALIYRNMLRDAARMGGEVFGPVPDGHRREFFCLDEHAWVWHEEWIDASGARQVRTTRYDVRPHGIFKVQDGLPYRPISGEEAQRLYSAVHVYQTKVHEKFGPIAAAQGV